jgi:hypothetical protein
MPAASSTVFDSTSRPAPASGARRPGNVAGNFGTEDLVGFTMRQILGPHALTVRRTECPLGKSGYSTKARR